MTAVLAFLLFVAVAAAVFLGIWGLSKREVLRGYQDQDEDKPTRFATELAAEVKKWQAEARYWRNTAERLQRELDERAGEGPGGG